MTAALWIERIYRLVSTMVRDPFQGRPIVGVMGSGADAHPGRSGALGRWLAEIGVHLLTGGGGGVMGAVSRAFQAVPDRAGLVIGVLPADPGAPGRAPRGYPNPWVEIAIRTHLSARGSDGGSLSSRNHVNVLSSSAIVALPGGAGTASEVRLARRYGVPLIAYLEDRGEIPDLPPEVRAESDFARVRQFVLEAIGRS